METVIHFIFRMGKFKFHVFKEPYQICTNRPFSNKNFYL